MAKPKDYISEKFIKKIEEYFKKKKLNDNKSSSKKSK